MAALTEDVVRKLPVRAALSPMVSVWVLFVLVGVVFWPTLVALGGIWLDVADYDYGPLTAAIALVLLFNASRRIDGEQVRFVPAALMLVVLAVLLWMIAWHASSDMLQQVLYPVVLWLCILAALGPAAAWTMAFPIGYMYFSIPIWDHFVPLLQWLTTLAAENAMALLGVPTQVEGHNVTIPAGQFSIIEGCSGKRYFVVGLAFAALAAVLHRLNLKKTIQLLAIAAVISLVTNWLRVIIVIYAGHLSNMQHYLVVVEHKTLGYAMFLPMLIAVGWLARRWGTQESVPLARVAAGRSVPLSWIAGPAAILAVAAGLLWRASNADAREPTLNPLPLLTGDWQGPLPASRDWQPHFIGARAERRASYHAKVGRIEMYLNVYGRQSNGHELVYYANSAAPPEAWTRVSWLQTDAPLSIGVFTSAFHERWVVAQTYVVDGRVSSSGAVTQLLYGWSALWSPAPSGAIALAARCLASCEAEAKMLDEFWNEHGEQLVHVIPGSL
jgi:exosortase